MIELTVNRKKRRYRGPSFKRLLDVLREDFELTGTKEGCGEGECGACTVLLDGEPVNSCLVPVAQAEGSRVETVEVLGAVPAFPLQQSFLEREERSADLHAGNAHDRLGHGGAGPRSESVWNCSRGISAGAPAISTSWPRS
jgi:hypothetical protein